MAPRDAVGAGRGRAAHPQGPDRPHLLDRRLPHALRCRVAEAVAPALAAEPDRAARAKDWLDAVRAAAECDYLLGVEVAACRGLVKGYGETIERGRERFAAIMTILPEIADRPDAAAIVLALRQAANADDTGAALNAQIGQLSDLRQAAE